MKCEFCECEWSLSPRYTKRLECCPFCGVKLAVPFIPHMEELTTLSEILSTIGRRFGDDVLRDGNKTLAFFSDIAPLQVREKTMLTRLISCDGQADLYDARLLPSSEQAVIFRKVVNRIVEEQLVAESIALEVCSSYWCALTGQDPTTMGNYTLPDGSVYEGEWKDDIRNGYGKMTWPGGRVYEGQLQKSIRNGIGKMTWPDGSVYEGEWKDGIRNGYGKMTWPDGRVYEGQYINGIKTGYGKMTWPDGKVYRGEWKDDKINSKP